MGRLVGIDIGKSQVRAVELRTSYKRVAVERMLEVDVATAGTLEQALLAAGLPLTQHSESVAVAIEGEHAFTHRLELPSTALKQLSEVVPFELEAQVPVDFDELVFDFRTLRRASNSDPIIVLAAAARTEDARARIVQLQQALGREPERIGCGPLPLANLAALSPELGSPAPVALVDLGGSRTELVVIAGGEAVFARTLSRGTEGLPDSAQALAAELRQTFASWALKGGQPVERAYLLGGGAAAPGAEEYLAYHLGVPVAPLPALSLEGVTPDQVPMLPRFAKAISLALGASGRSRDLDLRQGPLAYQRGYGFLKDKVPLLSGLGAAIVISFAFSTWAQARALSRENQVLDKTLSSLTMNVLGKKTSDPDEAAQLLSQAKAKGEPDPMPHMDAFDVIVQLSKAIPMSVTHDIEEFDMQRGHVRIDGVVNSTADAQLVAGGISSKRCIKDSKISKITQAVGSDRQKYVLEFEVKFPEDQSKKKKKKNAEDGQ
jgi:general secretion pathway protein L